MCVRGFVWSSNQTGVPAEFCLLVKVRDQGHLMVSEVKGEHIHILGDVGGVSGLGQHTWGRGAVNIKVKLTCHHKGARLKYRSF